MNKQISVRFVATVTVVSLLMSALPASFFVANAQTQDPEGTLNTSSTPYDNPQGKVRICHADNGNDNQKVNVSAIVGGTGHAGNGAGHATDIIPPFWYQLENDDPVQLYPGKNWETGQETWNDNCGEEEETPPVDVCPFKHGIQTNLNECLPEFEDKCPNVPGLQLTNLLCLPPPPPCPEGTIGIPPLCLPVFEDKCPDIDGHQFTNLLCPEPEKEEVTIEITGNTSAGENLPGWMFNRDTNTDTPIEFNDTQALIGEGSLEVFPIGANASDKFIGEYFWNGKIEDLESFVYNFKIGAGGVNADANEFYLNVYANFGESADTKFYDCRYNIVPATGSTASFTSVTFDPTVAYPVTTRTGGEASPYTCPAIPADMDDLSPDSTIRVFAINLGDTSLNDLGVDGYFDKVILDTETKKTTFDFEPAEIPACQYNPEIPADSDDCDPPATISLTKIICEDETMLPNDGFTSIDANTATNFLAQHEGCALESGFEFQTALGGQDVM